jgi:ubiquitin-protein ligase
MVDPLGAALGVAGLAGLFSTCVQCFDLVQLGRAYARDYEIIQTKFEAQKVRFLIWGQVVGVIEGSSYDTRLDLPEIRPTVLRILLNIRLLFSDGQQLSRRYGLRPDQGSLVAHDTIVFRETYRRFHARLSKTQKEASLFTTTKWAIADKQKFAALVQDLKDLIDSLDDITKSFRMLSERQEVINAEVESITDAASLRLLEQARSGSEDQISDAASQRLRILENQSNQPRARTILTGIQSLSIEDSFHTAPSHNIDLQEESGAVPRPESFGYDLPQNQRVVDQYRHRFSPFSRAKQTSSDLNRSIDFSAVGKALRDLKQADSQHTASVVQRYAGTSNPEKKRMVLILKNLLRSSPTTFVSLTPMGDNLFDLLGRIEGPPSSPYQGGVFHVRIQISDDFPWSPPDCVFLTKVYHPNIDAQGKICLDLLMPQHWRMEMMHLESILLSICALLDEPDVEDPLVPEIAAQYLQDKSRYEEIAREYTSRYARGETPVLTVTETSRATQQVSWQAAFLKERLEQIRVRNTALIQALDGQPRLDPEESLSVSAEDARDYVKLLYQLSLELGVLGQAFDDGTYLSVLSPAKFEELQNFFDFCSGEFRTLVYDEKWKTAFPNLPALGNDATRGTGNSFTYHFLERGRVTSVPLGEPIPESDSNPGKQEAEYLKVNFRLKRLERLVKHAKWLNGDDSLISSSTKVRNENSVNVRSPVSPRAATLRQ